MNTENNKWYWSYTDDRNRWVIDEANSIPGMYKAYKYVQNISPTYIFDTYDEAFEHADIHDWFVGACGADIIHEIAEKTFFQLQEKEFNEYMPYKLISMNKEKAA